MKRIPLKRTVTSLNRTPLKKSTGTLKRKAPDKQTVHERKAQSAKDWAFYESIWVNRSHTCEVHDGYKFLGYEPKKYMFDHLIEKSTHPELRYEPENIALVCSDCHSSKTNGHPNIRHQQ
jgi:5-methylcytosine-specific restriction endonuclease McrA